VAIVGPFSICHANPVLGTPGSVTCQASIPFRKAIWFVGGLHPPRWLLAKLTLVAFTPFANTEFVPKDSVNGFLTSQPHPPRRR